MEMAREALSAPADMARQYRAHPGYPIAIVAAERLLIGLGAADNSASMELAGRLVSLVAALGACVAAWKVARMAYDPQVAAVTLLLLAVSRKWAMLGSDVLSDALAASLGLWAVVFILAAAGSLRRYSRWAVPASAACGLCVGAGYLVRPEVLLIVPVAAVLLAATARRFRAGWKLPLASLAGLVLVVVACGLPYVLATGRWTNKQDLIGPIGIILDGPFGGRGAADLPRAALAGWFGDAERASTELLDKFFEAQHPVLAWLTVIGLAMHAARRFRPSWASRFAWPPPSWETRTTMVAATAVFFVAVQSYGLRTGILSHRYLLLPALLLSPLAGATMVHAAKAAAEALRRRGFRRAAAAALPLALGVAVVAMLVHALRPGHIGKAHHRQAGVFIASLAQPGDRLLTDDRWVLHYAVGVSGVAMVPDELDGLELANLIADCGATILAVGQESAAKAHLGDDRQIGSLGLTLVRRFDPDLPGKSETVYVYRVAAVDRAVRRWDFSAGLPSQWRVSPSAVVAENSRMDGLEVTTDPARRDYQLWSTPFGLSAGRYRLMVEAVVVAGGLHLGCEDVETGTWIAQQHWLAPGAAASLSLDVGLPGPRHLCIALSAAGDQPCRWRIRRITIVPTEAQSVESSPANRETMSR
jgi:hypothetical protein